LVVPGSITAEDPQARGGAVRRRKGAAPQRTPRTWLTSAAGPWAWTSADRRSGSTRRPSSRRRPSAT